MEKTNTTKMTDMGGKRKSNIHIIGQENRTIEQEEKNSNIEWKISWKNKQTNKPLTLQIKCHSVAQENWMV